MIVFFIILIAAVIVTLGYFFLPQIIIGAIQKAIYKNGRAINSFEPFSEPVKDERADGSYYASEIAYGTKYPNSYLDIIYNSKESSTRPTVIYFHGGGFFCGDKTLGDPMAVESDAGAILNEIVSAGYNLVSVNYALAPQHHFPTPLIQMNEAIEFLDIHSSELGLNMNNVVLFGQSAGAILVSQYAALLMNEEYRAKLNIYPLINRKKIKLLVIDDAPLTPEKYNFALWIMMSNYIGSGNIKSEKVQLCNPLPYIGTETPPTFMTAGNTDGFPYEMQALSDRLRENGVDYEYFYRDRSYADLCHGYLNQLKTNEYARECFLHLLNFMKKYTD